MGRMNAINPTIAHTLIPTMKKNQAPSRLPFMIEYNAVGARTIAPKSKIMLRKNRVSSDK